MGTVVRFKLNTVGIGEILKGHPVELLVRGACNTVAKNVGAQGLTASSGAAESGEDITAVFTVGTTDRAHGSVTIQHPAGLAMQATHGVLTKAAAAAGLEVKGKGAAS